MEGFERHIGEMAVFEFFPVPKDELALGEVRSKVLHEAADMVEREDAEAVDMLDLEMLLGSLNGVGEGGEGVGGEFWRFGGAAGGDVDRLDGEG